ncbi:MAG: nucleotidyltransferase family protein [Halobacteriota archaeon]
MNKDEFDFLDIPAPDRDLISSFVSAVQTWAPINLKSIVLYGSVAKGIFPEVYDIDIVVLFSSDFDHPQFYTEVYRMITELEPQRELHVVLKCEAEIEPAFQELIEEEGITLFP